MSNTLGKVKPGVVFVISVLFILVVAWISGENGQSNQDNRAIAENMAIIKMAEGSNNPVIEKAAIVAQADLDEMLENKKETLSTTSSKKQEKVNLIDAIKTSDSPFLTAVVIGVFLLVAIAMVNMFFKLLISKKWQ